MGDMTLKEYRKKINNKELDQYEDLIVITSIDDEGNSFNRVFYDPGLWEDEDGIELENGLTKKAICIN